MQRRMRKLAHFLSHSLLQKYEKKNEQRKCIGCIKKWNAYISSFLWAFFYSLFLSLMIFLPILFAFFWTIEWIKCEEGLVLFLTFSFDDKQDANRNDKRNISSSYFLHGFLYFSDSRRYKKDAKRKWGHAIASMQLAHTFCNIFYIFLIERNIKRDAEDMSRIIVFVLILALI